MKNRSGTYLILLFNRKIRFIETGRLGVLKYNPGYYLYVGSALNGVENRVKRHLSIPEKKHWHIDRISPYFEKIGAVIIYSEEKLECIVSKIICKSALIEGSVKKFGSTDCNCSSHLYRITDKYYLSQKNIIEKIETLLLPEIVNNKYDFEIRLIN